MLYRAGIANEEERKRIHTLIERGLSNWHIGAQTGVSPRAIEFERRRDETRILARDALGSLDM